jgi:hypothetical protein
MNTTTKATLAPGTRVRIINSDYDGMTGKTGTITNHRLYGAYAVQIDNDTPGATAFPFDEVEEIQGA